MTVRVWLLGIMAVSGLAWLVSHSFYPGWIFAVSGLAFCVSGVGPLVDEWDAKRMRRKQ